LFPVAAPASPALSNAEVAELADAHGSGPCTRKGVGVRVPSSALFKLFIFNSLNAIQDLPARRDKVLNHCKQAI
jgi:hypothetical protein